jgi:hypothetical protein
MAGAFYVKIMSKFSELGYKSRGDLQTPKNILDEALIKNPFSMPTQWGEKFEIGVGSHDNLKLQKL